jgi:hypothetical protein
MMIKNFHDIATGQAVFWNVASKRRISVEIEAQGEFIVRESRT